MTEIPKGEGSKFPTLMKNFETDEDLDDYVIDNAHMFVIIQIRPGGFVNGYGSNYTRTEITFEKGKDDPREALNVALEEGKRIYAQTGRALLIYAVADFAGAIGFNRPVRQIPEPTFRSKADMRRDEARARKLRQIERARARELEGKAKAPKTPKPRAAVFKTDLGTTGPAPKPALVEEEFYATDKPMARLIRD